MWLYIVNDYDFGRKITPDPKIISDILGFFNLIRVIIIWLQHIFL